MPQTDDWQYDPIFERELTTRRPAGGTIRSVEIAQLPSSEWIINVRVSWRDDKWLNVCLWEQPTIKTYKRLSSAIRHVVFDYGYEDDHIRVVPNKECSNRVAFCGFPFFLSLLCSCICFSMGDAMKGFNAELVPA